MHPTPKQMILGLCVFSLSLIAIACSPKTKDAKESITVNTPPAASVPTNEDKAIPKYDHIFVIFDPKSNANFGGGHIATIVITNHGSRGVVDKTAYNHYSFL